MIANIHRTARIDRSADVVDTARIGPACTVGPRVTILEDAHIAKSCHISADVTIGHSVTMGESCEIGRGAILGADTQLEREVRIGPHAICRAETAPRVVSCETRRKSRQKLGFGQITLGQGATVGPQAVIEAEATIGCYALIGAGAVVNGDVPDYGLMVGNPAQLVGYVCRQGHRLTQMADGRWHCPSCDETVPIASDADAALAPQQSATPGIVRRWLG